MNKYSLNETGEKVAQSRYYQKNEKGEVIEKWGDLVLRVVNHVCKDESKELKEKMMDLIGKTEFLPNSPCLVNAGRKMNKPGLMACYVSKAPEDSWDSMCDTIKNFGRVARAGGGCGLFLGDIRPEGDQVFGSTHAKACGPIEMMRMLSETMSSITQSGFRAMALMASLNVSHPDIINFIQCKQKERALKTLLKEDIFKHYPQIINNIEPQLKIILDKFIHNFNISVLISDKFMEAVEKDQDWNLEFNSKVYKTIKAKDLFDLIVENAWKNGDPGILMEDTINKTSPYRFSGQYIKTSNPCQNGSAPILTPFGIKQLKDIKIGDEIWSETGWTIVKNKWSNGIKEVYKYVTSAGVFYGTENHRIISNNEKIEVKDAESIDILSGEFKSDINYDPQDIMDGIVLGDGSVHDSNNKTILLHIGENDQDYLSSEIKDLIIKKYYPKVGTTEYKIKTTISASELCKTYDRDIPERFFYGDRNKICSFLRGFYTANGSICNNRVTLKTSSSKIREKIQILLSSIGIKSYFTTNKSHDVEFKNGTYLCRESYDINITRDKNKFNKIIGFIQKYKADKLNSLINKENKYIGNIKNTYEIKEASFFSEEEVFDMTVDNETHTYWTAGLNVSNCSEQVLPSSNANCNLGSIDVSKFYNDKKEEVDWKRLEEAIRNSFQFLDDVIDQHNFPDDSFKQWGMDNRPVGLGVMGFADLLLKLKIKYGSEESVKFAEKLMKFFADVSHNKSVELGKEKGTPKSCQYKELENRRNVTTTSIAPTGSISLLAGCSSSIEPVFSATTFRHDNTGSYETKHLDADKKWFACALDNDGGPKEVKYQEHIAIQAAFQKFCDSGISKTINCCSSTTIDEIKEIYKLAWRSGCKGVTIYRNNSKTTQVLNLTNKVDIKPKDETKQKIARPPELPCDIFKIKADGIEWHIIIGLKDKNPYELFAVNGGKVLPEKGIITKIKKKHYSLLDENKNVLLENIIESENKIDAKVGLETRRFSLELRHGIPPQFIVEQIDKSSDVITSFSKAAARIFKKNYLASHTISGILCPECLKEGRESKLIFVSGCNSCQSCSYSRC